MTDANIYNIYSLPVNGWFEARFWWPTPSYRKAELFGKLRKHGIVIWPSMMEQSSNLLMACRRCLKQSNSYGTSNQWA